MLVELLRPAGAELARRWLSALLLVPEDERASIVASVEERIVEEYRSGRGRSPGDDHRSGNALHGVVTPPRTELRDLARAEAESVPRKARKKRPSGT